MKIQLLNAHSMSINSLEDLRDLVPECSSGMAINYGQGEGQIRIGDTEWGFYTGNFPCFVFEEGTLDFDQAIAMASGILAKIRKKWGQDISGRIEGSLHPELGGFV